MLHDERLARNEAQFRTVNEAIREVAAEHGGDSHVYEFLCECSDIGCSERLPLTIAEYERIRSDGRRFVLAPGHDVPAIESIVETRAQHVVVEKTGAAGTLAEALDPRPA